MNYKKYVLLILACFYSFTSFSQFKVVKHIQKITDKRFGSGVLVRIKNTGSKSVSAYSIICDKKTYSYDGLISGDSTAYSFIPFISGKNKIEINLILNEKMHFTKGGYCQNCVEEIKDGKITLLINTFYDENEINTLYQNCKIDITYIVDKK